MASSTGLRPKSSRNCTSRPDSSRKFRSRGSCALSCGSKPTFWSCAGRPEDDLPTLSGIVCAPAAKERASSVTIPAMERMQFIILFFLFRRGRGRSRQTFLGDNLHRVFHGNLSDAAILIDPACFLVVFRIFLDFHA